jgi:hypothetical protein
MTLNRPPSSGIHARVWTRLDRSGLHARFALAEIIAAFLRFTWLLLDPALALRVIPRKRIENAISIAILLFAIEPILVVDAQFAAVAI